MSQWDDPTRGYDAGGDTRGNAHVGSGYGTASGPSTPPGSSASGASMAPPPGASTPAPSATAPGHVDAGSGFRRLGPSGVPELWPGPIPLRPLSFGEMLECALSVLRFNPRTVFGLSLLLVLGSMVITGIVTGVGMAVGLASAGIFGSDSGAAAVAEIAGSGVMNLISLLSSLIFAVLGGLLIVPIADATLGRRTTVKGSWHRLKGRLLPLAGYFALVVLANVLLVVPGVVAIVAAIASGQEGVIVTVVILALLYLVVALVYVNVSLVPAPVALVLEGLGPIASIRRSFSLIRGSWWRTFAITLVVGILTATVQMLLMVPLMLVATIFGLAGLQPLLAGADPGVGAILGVVVAILVLFAGLTAIDVLVRPYSAAIQSMIYLDRRFRTEALAVDLLAEAERTTVR